MPLEKYRVGEKVEMRCQHMRDGQRVTDWLAGTVVEADNRMLAVRFETGVFTNTGWPVPERVLWCTHGSPNLRRAAAQAGANSAASAGAPHPKDKVHK